MAYVELKSAYLTEDICKAQKQIVATCVKMKAIFSTLQGYNSEEYKQIGIIAAFELNMEEKTSFNHSQRQGEFALSLYQDRHKYLQTQNCLKFFRPFMVNGMDLYYVPVPRGKTSYEVSMNSILHH